MAGRRVAGNRTTTGCNENRGGLVFDTGRAVCDKGWCLLLLGMTDGPVRYQVYRNAVLFLPNGIGSTHHGGTFR